MEKQLKGGRVARVTDTDVFIGIPGSNSHPMESVGVIANYGTTNGVTNYGVMIYSHGYPRRFSNREDAKIYALSLLGEATSVEDHEADRRAARDGYNPNR